MFALSSGVSCKHPRDDSRTKSMGSIIWHVSNVHQLVSVSNEGCIVTLKEYRPDKDLFLLYNSALLSRSPPFFGSFGSRMRSGARGGCKTLWAAGISRREPIMCQSPHSNPGRWLETR
jgi:hypothetical protein